VNVVFVRGVLAAVMSAGMLTLAFPKAAWWPLTLIGLAPVLFVLLYDQARLNWRGAFLLGYVCGVMWFTASLWWIGYVTVAGMMVLVQLLAVFMGGSLALGWWLVRRGVAASVAFTAVWLVYETIQTYFMTGFPWMLLGYGLRPVVPMIQIADVTGVYGVSGVVVLVNVAVADAGYAWAGRLGWRGCWKSVVQAVCVAGISVLYGVWRMRALETPARSSVRIGLVQANIPSLVKHDSTRDYDVLQRHVVLTRALMNEHVALVIWPETALPGYFFERRLSYHTVTKLVDEIKRPLITGLARYTAGGDGALTYYNSAAVIEPGGLVTSMYDKRHLVMFGEYVPFERYLPFLKLVTPIEGSFTAGRCGRGIVYRAPDGYNVVFKVLICFEDVVAEMARIHGDEPADVLLNLTNDGWFRSSPGPYQHAALSVFRAVEQRRPLVRATNSGVSMIVDRMGRTRAVLARRGKMTEIAGTLVDDVPLHRGTRTLYARGGNWLLWLACGGTLGLVIVLNVTGRMAEATREDPCSSSSVSAVG